MSGPAALYQDFLGSWQLIVESCDYQQGDPPRSGSYEISEESERLVFKMRWIDAEGASHEMQFSGVPDGSQEPFAGGELADALCVESVSPRELNSVATFRGKRRMVAQRQLDETGMAMRVTQVIFLPDGSHLANVAVYRKVVSN